MKRKRFAEEQIDLPQALSGTQVEKVIRFDISRYSR